jgi:hypothetical protein
MGRCVASCGRPRARPIAPQAVYALDPGYGNLTELSLSGSTVGGFEFERSVIILYLHEATGAMGQLAMFPPEELAAARARHDELVAAARAAAGGRPSSWTLASTRPR